MNKKIFFFNTIIAEENLDQILKIYKNPFLVAQQNLEMGLYKGMLEETNDINSITMPNTPLYLLSKSTWMKPMVKNGFADTNTSTYLDCKVKGLRNIIHLLYTFWFVIKNGKEVRNQKLFLTCNYLPISIPLIVLRSIYRYEITCMYCDFTIDIDRGKNIIRKLYTKLTSSIDKKFDKYVLIAKAMKEPLKIKENHYIIMEGIYNDNLIRPEVINRKNNFVYSGSLIKKYGIEKIIDVFIGLNSSLYELHIYGDGPYKNEMLEKIKDHQNIKYYGLIDRKELFTVLCNSKYLFNLRNPDENYTKYSFPSKILEYLASGSLVVSTRLEGIPIEYFNYIYPVEQYDTKDIVKQIDKLIMQDYHEFQQRLHMQVEFIQNEKSYKKQAQRVLTFVKEDL